MTKDKNLHYAKGAAVRDAIDTYNEGGIDALLNWDDPYSDIGTGEKWLNDARGLGYAGPDNVYQPEEIQRLLADSSATWNAAPKEAKFGKLTDKLQEYLPYLAMVAPFAGAGSVLGGLAKGTSALGKVGQVLVGGGKFSNNPLTNMASKMMLSKVFPQYGDLSKKNAMGQQLAGVLEKNKLASGLVKNQNAQTGGVKPGAMYGSSIKQDAMKNLADPLKGMDPNIKMPTNPAMAFAGLGVQDAVAKGQMDPLGAAAWENEATGANSWDIEDMGLGSVFSVGTGVKQGGPFIGNTDGMGGQYKPSAAAEQIANIQKQQGGGFMDTSGGGLGDLAKLSMFKEIFDMFGKQKDDKPAPMPGPPAGGGGGGGMPTYGSLVGFATNKDAQDDQYNRWRQRNGRLG